MKETLEKIKEKIKNKDFNFSRIEYKYIERYRDLIMDISESIDANYELINRDLYNFFMNGNVDDVNLFSEGFIYSLVKSDILYNPDLDSSSYYFDIDRYIFNDERRNELKQLLIENMQTNHESVYYDVFRDLLRNKQFDIINNLSSVNIYDTRDKSIFEEIKNLYPFQKLGFPKCLAFYANHFQEYIELMSLDELISLSQDEKTIDMDEAINLTLKRLEDPEEVKKIKDIESLYNFLNTLSDTAKQKYFDILWNNGIYLDNDKIYDSSYHDELFLENIKNNNYSYESLSYILREGITSYENIDDILEIIYDKCDLITFFKLDPFNPKVIEYKDKIINDINNGNSKVIEAFKNNTMYITKNKDICIVLLKNNAVDNFSYVASDFAFYYDAYYELISYIKRNPNFVVKPCYNDEPSPDYKICEALISVGHYEDFISYYGNYPHRNEALDGNDLSYLEHDRFLDFIYHALDRNEDLAVVLASNCVSHDALIFESNDILYKVIEKNDICASYVLNTIHHNEELDVLYDEHLYKAFKPYFLRNYDIKEDNLHYMYSKYGPLIVKYIDNENILELLKMDIVELQQIMDIFPTIDYDVTTLVGAYDNVKQYEFGFKYPDVISIFSNIVHSIEDGEDYSKYLSTLAEYVPLEFINNLVSKYNLKYDGNILNLLISITDDIKNDKDRVNNLNILHEITDYYIDSKRTDYKKTYNAYEDLNIKYTYEPVTELSYLADLLIKQSGSEDQLLEHEGIAEFDFPEVDSDIITKYNFDSYVVKRMLGLGVSESITRDCLNFLRDPNYKLVNDRKQVVSKIKDVKNIAKEVVSKYKHSLSLMIDMDEHDKKVKKNYYVGSSPTDYYRILSQIRLDVIKDKLLTNEDAYKALVDLMRKRKLHKLPNELLEYINSSNLDLEYDESLIPSFVTYFYDIYERELMLQQSLGKGKEDISFNVTSVIKKGLSYNCLFSAYYQILGNVDAALIKANSGPNAATRKVTNGERIDEAVEWTINNFERDKVTVPPIDDVFTHEDKKMRIVVGNFTDPCNLTHGERTGACMRIGGVGESLFEFALENENGFHIRFMDANTDKYISRVTGFRNGNTIFLNELRDSCDPDLYDNNDVVEFCKIIARELIERSKDSSCPIDNVVVHSAYAASEMKADFLDLGVKNIKEGLPQFYSDVNSFAKLVCSSDPNGKLVPVNLDKSNVPTYKPCRGRIMKSDDMSKLIGQINRVHAINIFKDTRNIGDIDTLFVDDNFVYGFANDDWYIYLDKFGVVHEEILPYDKRATIELEEARKVLMEQQMKFTSQGNLEQGSVSHGI